MDSRAVGGWLAAITGPARPLYPSPAIADLEAAPHERVSLMRLLVCLTQAALGAPEDDFGWPGFGSKLTTAVPAYLDRPDIHPHFNLLGPGPRFLQVKVPVREEPVPASKLMPQLATGNNPTPVEVRPYASGKGVKFSALRLLGKIAAVPAPIKS